MAYTIHLSDEAVEHLAGLTARRRALVLDAIEHQLVHQPMLVTRNRKPMEPEKAGFVAPWELRVGELRVYYDVENRPGRRVVIVAIGEKVRDRVWIGGREYEP